MRFSLASLLSFPPKLFPPSLGAQAFPSSQGRRENLTNLGYSYLVIHQICNDFFSDDISCHVQNFFPCQHAAAHRYRQPHDGAATRIQQAEPASRSSALLALLKPRLNTPLWAPSQFSLALDHVHTVMYVREDLPTSDGLFFKPSLWIAHDLIIRRIDAQKPPRLFLRLHLN